MRNSRLRGSQIGTYKALGAHVESRSAKARRPKLLKARCLLSLSPDQGLGKSISVAWLYGQCFLTS